MIFTLHSWDACCGKNYLLQTDAPAAVAKSTALRVAKLRPHHKLLSLMIPAAAMAAVVPPMI